MKKITVLIAALALGAMFATGCAGLSLFSSKHTHYHKSPETDQKIERLEHRVQELERETQ